MVRAARCLTYARRDKEIAFALEPALQAEQDAEVKHWMELAIDTLLKKRDLREFDNFRTKVLKETRARPGQGGRAPGGGAPGGGGNAGGGN